MEKMGTRTNRVKPTRRIVIITLSILTLITILAIGLGVGLRKRSHPSETQTPTDTTNNTDVRQSLWQPDVNNTWQIILNTPLKLPSTAKSITPDVDVFDIDLYTNTQTTIQTLHDLGKRVVCYFSAGSYEPYRPDSAQFVAADLGNVLAGWEDEKWLNISSPNVRAIMAERVKLACGKGCDGLDMDNIDGYENENGLDLTKQNAVDFVRFLAAEAQKCNMSVGLKNGGELVPSLLPYVQYAINEQCVSNNECTTFAPFIAAGKPVFHIEYPTISASKASASEIKTICSISGDAKGSDSFSTVLKKMNLDGWVEFCDGNVAVTEVETG